MIYENVSNEEHHKTYEDLYFEGLKNIIKLKQQIKEAEKALDKMNKIVVGREYGLDSEEILEITREYKNKYNNEVE